MDWKFLKLTTLFTFIFLSISVQAVNYTLKDLRKKKIEFLIEKESLQGLTHFLEEGIKEKNIPTRVKKIYRIENENAKKFKQIADGGALEIRNLLIRKYDEYFKFSEKKFDSVGFSPKYNEALYLLYLSKQLNEKSRNDEIDSFSYLLTFIANRLSFNYSSALEIYKQLENKKIKNMYKSILKRFVEMEYTSSSKGEIPPQFQLLF